MAHTVPEMPYPYDALEPYIDARTMEIHYTKHHAGYVSKLNDALEGHPDLAAKSIEALLGEVGNAPDSIRQKVINNGGGHANHSMFWQIMGPGKGGQPKGALADEIKSVFGSFDTFKKTFTDAAATRFGSGWAWLTRGRNGKLEIFSTPNQNSPIMDGYKPIFGLDVWEHAYYLKYQNRRADYIAAWWNTVNWDAVADRYSKAK